MSFNPLLNLEDAKLAYGGFGKNTYGFVPILWCNTFIFNNIVQKVTDGKKFHYNGTVHRGHFTRNASASDPWYELQKVYSGITPTGLQLKSALATNSVFSFQLTAATAWTNNVQIYVTLNSYDTNAYLASVYQSRPGVTMTIDVEVFKHDTGTDNFLPVNLTTIPLNNLKIYYEVIENPQ
jgi:hypothetical protein